LASPSLAGPGIDLAVNRVCPGVTGASGEAPLDCVSLAAAHQFVSIYSTFIPAENISDLGSLDGIIDIWLTRSVNAEGAFWDSSPGGCLEQHGGQIQFLGTKPTNGDPCGTPATIREVFVDGGSMTTNLDDPNHLRYFYTVYTFHPQAVTAGERVFGFEIRLDPQFAAENGGACGSCCQPMRCGSIECDEGVIIDMVSAKPSSYSGAPTTTLTSGTGLTTVNSRGHYSSAAYCNPVPTRRSTWGALKSLYR